MKIIIHTIIVLIDSVIIKTYLNSKVVCSANAQRRERYEDRSERTGALKNRKTCN